MQPTPFIKQLENEPVGTKVNQTVLLDNIQFNADGLIPVIAQEHKTNEVLMLAWMNRQALEETLSTKQVCYWSRSRQALWRKGESSGHRQTLVAACLDCDADTLLIKVEQLGAACHTQRHDCFYISLDDQQAFINKDPLASD